ncbi:MAG: branched-chain amino acid ABC transporter permease [bacterium]
MELRQRYEEDLFLVRGAAAWLATAALLAALALFPFYSPRYLLFPAILVAINATVAVGLNVLTGLTGQISLGHAGFVGIGAYAATLLAARLDFPWFLAWPAAGLIAAAFGVLVGVPALRLTGPYLTIATLGFGVAVHQVLTNWEALSGGRMGLPVPRVAFGPAALTNDQRLYYLAVGVAVLLTWAAANLARSHVGRAFVALRDSDIAAEVMGVNLTRYKVLAFAVSAFYAGIGGALFAQALRHLEPQSFDLLQSITYFAMIVVGGLGTVSGAVLGAGVITLLPGYLGELRAWLPVIFGTAIILIMMVEPRGLYGRWLRIRRYFKSWPM